METHYRFKSSFATAHDNSAQRTRCSGHESDKGNITSENMMSSNRNSFAKFQTNVFPSICFLWCCLPLLPTNSLYRLIALMNVQLCLSAEKTLFFAYFKAGQSLKSVHQSKLATCSSFHTVKPGQSASQ